MNLSPLQGMAVLGNNQFTLQCTTKKGQYPLYKISNQNTFRVYKKFLVTITNYLGKKFDLYFATKWSLLNDLPG